MSTYEDPPVANSDAEFYNLIDSMSLDTRNLLNVVAHLGQGLKTPDDAADYLVNTVAPALQRCMTLLKSGAATQAEAMIISRLLMTALGTALSVGEARDRFDIIGAIKSLSGF